MSGEEELPKCLVCRKRRTEDAYELGDSELDHLEHTLRIWRAPRVQRKFGAVPICRACFDRLGFELEGGRPGDSPGLVSIVRRKPDQ